MKHAADVRRAGIALVADGLSYSEAARQLRVPVGSLYNWCTAQRLARHRAEVAARRSPDLPTFDVGLNIAGVIIDEVLGHYVRPGVYAPRHTRTQSMLDRLCYRVHCAVCGAGMAPVSHRRLARLEAEYDVVHCIHCWKKERRT